LQVAAALVYGARNQAHPMATSLRYDATPLPDSLTLVLGNILRDNPCPTGLYGWRTAGASSPGKNYVKFKTQGGQDFYTLSPGYLKNPAHPDGK
jgi:hypothetical protein